MKNRNGPLSHDRPYFTAKEAAALIGVGVQTLYRYGKHKNKNQRPPVKRYSSRCLRYPKKPFLLWAGIEEGA